MKKLIVFLCVLLCPVVLNASGLMLMSGGVEEEATCPSWDSDYPVAWDGSCAGGQNYACLSGAEVAGTNVSGTFSGSGASTLWTFDTTDDRLWWAITSSDIDADSATGYTICAEFTIISGAASDAIFEIYGGASDHAYLSITSSASYSNYYSTAGGGEAASGPGATRDGATPNIGCITWKIVGSGADHSICLNDCSDGSPTWADDTDGLQAWNVGAPEAAIMIGNLYAGSTGSDDFSVNKFVVLPGFKTTCPF